MQYSKIYCLNNLYYHKTTSHIFNLNCSNFVVLELMYKDFRSKHPTFTCFYELHRLAVKAKYISFTKLGHEECECCTVFENHGHSKENIDLECETCKTYSVHIKRLQNQENA